MCHRLQLPHTRSVRLIYNGQVMYHTKALGDYGTFGFHRPEIVDIVVVNERSPWLDDDWD